MIISRTPLRISFAGGLTDIREFYENNRYGAVISTSINKYVYITVNKKFDNKVRVSYSKTEIVDDVKEIQHPIVREVLKLLNVKGGIEITCIGDFPSGTGMGSSSAFTVGLLNAVHAYLGDKVSYFDLAEEACNIEIDILKEPIGKQDQYACSFGGFNYIAFKKEDTDIYPIMVRDNIKNKIDNNLSLHYIGMSGYAKDVLPNQIAEFKKKRDDLIELRNNADKMRDIFSHNYNVIEEFGSILHDAWLLKREMPGVTNPEINKLCSEARKNGALGEKILGAGGRGFLLLYSTEQHDSLLEFMEQRGYPETKFSFENEGSKIVYEGEK